ncbi:OmpA family protein [Chitiniphilus eburneus]|uniref:Glycine zipper 2TM domain-containing protein n=1 Tax=Chitiniphilus eburneus TaxID=2571148 RepID=A0A4U0Q879_9NEIS|nr:OmpA family protein [Chitiniphilus eburneus]TJZ77471.1 glycine zipper 2TM domain-containing protein [Chitiniphilus eburneus]
MRKTVSITIIAALLLSACATNDLGDKRDLNNTEKGAIIGTLGGAAVGALVNHKNRGKGALIGAVGGGLAGGGIGYYMDNQAKDLQKQLAPEMSRGEVTIQKQADNSLLVSMTSTTGFDTNSAALKPAYTPTLDKIARVVNQYGKTMITVVGHTDSVGKDAYNQTLSEQRARAVADYFVSRQVNPVRLDSYGKGETEPRASNDTEDGRRMNRRVELWIMPVKAGN